MVANDAGNDRPSESPRIDASAELSLDAGISTSVPPCNDLADKHGVSQDQAKEWEPLFQNPQSNMDNFAQLLKGQLPLNQLQYLTARNGQYADAARQNIRNKESKINQIASLC